ncbi:MAG: hypothetical protein WCF88_03570 [Candidatus Acidiferrales bacterium]|jgi:hypothetical protein
MAQTTHHPSHPVFQQDFGEYLLEVPRRRPRFDWFLLAIAAGAVIAFAVFSIANLIF